MITGGICCQNENAENFASDIMEKDALADFLNI